MNKENIILNELINYNLNPNNIKNLQEIQDKDGIILYRYTYEDQQYVIKYFDNKKFRREIFYYQLLNKTNVPTMKVYDSNKQSLILEDIKASNSYRLGISNDLSDPIIALGLIKWYKKLHHNSKQYLIKHPRLFKKLYSEYTLITKKIIKDVMIKTNSVNYDYWKNLLKSFNKIKKIVKNQTNCLTYNDFYYTNFIVSNDKKDVIMFDYNMLGKGFVYSDIRNVVASLSGKAKEVFNKYYNEYEPITKAIDEVLSVIFTLYEAYKRDSFPKWASDELDKIHNGSMEKDVNHLIDLIK